MKKRYLALWIWLCEDKLKVKVAHFRLPSASQKRACLSSQNTGVFCKYKPDWLDNDKFLLMKSTPSFFLVNKGKEITINQEKISKNFKKPEQSVMRKLYPDLIHTGLFLVFRRNIIGTRFWAKSTES